MTSREEVIQSNLSNNLRGDEEEIKELWNEQMGAFRDFREQLAASTRRLNELTEQERALLQKQKEEAKRIYN